MNNRKLIRNISAVSLGALALALCSLPQNGGSDTKRMPMPSPQHKGGEKQLGPAKQGPARTEFPKPDFGGKQAVGKANRLPGLSSAPETANDSVPTAVAEPPAAPPDHDRVATAFVADLPAAPPAAQSLPPSKPEPPPALPVAQKRILDPVVIAPVQTSASDSPRSGAEGATGGEAGRIIYAPAPETASSELEIPNSRSGQAGELSGHDEPAAPESVAGIHIALPVASVASATETVSEPAGAQSKEADAAHPLGEPIDQSPPQAAVKVWDFATGVPISPVIPDYQGLETNDNQVADSTSQEMPGPTVAGASLASLDSDRAEMVEQVTTEPDSDASSASALDTMRAQEPVPVAETGAEQAEQPPLAEQTAAEESPALASVAAEAAPPAHEAGPEADPASDEETDAAPASSTANSTGTASVARVWDFATGKPLTPPPSPVAEEESNPPKLADGAAGNTPEEVSGSIAAESPLQVADSVGEQVESQHRARVWDFATGKPVGSAEPETAAGMQNSVAIAQQEEAVIEAASSTVSDTSPHSMRSGEPLVITPQDELILEVRVKGINASDTIIAYGTPDGVFLPLGNMARILDLALTVSDDGNYAHGWLLDESRTLSIDLREGVIEFDGKRLPLDRSLVAPFEGEIYLKAEEFARYLPLEIKADLRAMAIMIETLQPFPFEERARRDAQRERLAARQSRPEGRNFERVDLPWAAASVPAADIEIRAVSDDVLGERLEGDLRLAGDLGYLTAEAYLSGETQNGLTAALLELGRVDPDGDLLGPLDATSFSIGDISTETMPLGLRSVTGRGFTVTNAASQLTSVFDRVDLRGILPDGYEVELYRNDVLIGSTRDAVNGQYEFLQVPVDFGLNVFRLVFYGPQGQRNESVRRITVGDGRVAKGEFVYNFNAAQKDRNLLGVEPPNFVPPRDYGNWRAGGQLAYGVSQNLTVVLSGAWFERDGNRWISSAGVRTSIGGIAVKGDLGIADGGAMAFAGGLGGRFGRSAITLSHSEYDGLFPDETKAAALQFLRRATEIDFNTTIELGNPSSGLVIPLSARVRNYVDIDGRNTLLAGVRASTRTSGLLLSNTLDYSRTSSPDFETNARLFGNFDLATIGRSDTRARFSLGYEVAPDPDIVNAGIQIDHALDSRTALRASANYDFSSKSPGFGASAIREFDRFSLALDGNYSFANDAYYVGLRLGFSLGRDPMSKRIFMSKPGMATQGGATLRAFQDMDGDGIYGPADKPLPDVDFVAFNQTATTDQAGTARLEGLGSGRGVGIQIDPTSLPDISLAPAKPGVEVVPRAGRLHLIDYPVIAVSEIEGIASFVSEHVAKAVSGVRLALTEENGKVIGIARTEVDGYYFFERVAPGNYRLTIEPEQAERLDLCPAELGTISVGYEPDVIVRDIEIRSCEIAQPVIAESDDNARQAEPAVLASASR